MPSKKIQPDYGNMALKDLERLLNLRQKKFIAFLLAGLSQTEAAIQAGYSPKTAASQATDLLKNPKVSAYRRAYTHAVLDQLCLTPESIALRLFDIYERCMQKKPVLVWSTEDHAWVESGKWQFDSKGATRVLELLGKNAGMFTERVQISGNVGGLEAWLTSAARETGAQGHD